MASYTKHFNTNSGQCNHQEHKRWNRRSFLQALGLVGGGTMALANSPISVSQPSPLSTALNNVENDRILILVRLKGGNDGLNTVIPLYDYDTYARRRSNIRIRENQYFKLSDDFAMPNYTGDFQNMWGEGQMKIVHGVGYENSSLSHFKGSDIWATTDPKDQEESGWMGRYFQEIHPDYLTNPPAKPTAIQIGNNGNLIFNAQDTNYAFAVADPKKLLEIAQNGELYDLTKIPDCTHGEKVGYLKGIANTTFAYAGVINEAYDKSSDYGNYPTNNLSRQLRIIARLIKGNLGTKVYMVELGGFDTHNNQKIRHEELLTDLSKTISYFYQDLKASGWDDKVLSMTISEFGRRVSENGSGGTDHGAASQSMIFGSALEGNGFIGKHPNLSDLDPRGNLKPNTDFRQLYATVLKEWMCVDPNLVNEILLGQNYDPISLGFGCTTLSTPDTFIPKEVFDHVVTYKDNQTYLNLKMQNTAHVVIQLFDILGKEIAVLKNQLLYGGNHVIDIKQSANTRLESGQYIYKISIGKRRFSNSLIIG